MNELYPLKFNPIYKEKIWGGKRMKTILNKDISLSNCGESWEISTVNENISVVNNGFLAGNNLNELIEIYMSDLVGDIVFQEHGNNFPLLIKFIDASDDLSIQVHPDDDMAMRRYDSNGKTEMWYVINSEPNSKIITGFNKKIDEKKLQTHIKNNTLHEILNVETANAGDVFFIPAGRIHAIGKGILLTEIQQSSDITYRIYDYNRKDNDGKMRELHINEAIDVIDYNIYDNYKTKYSEKLNDASPILTCPNFSCNIIHLNQPVSRDYILIDSFVIYICIDGVVEVIYNNKQHELISKGECMLVPAMYKTILLNPLKESKLLEVYIP